MKIKEEIKTLGDFWLPATPERKVPGMLSISNERGIELETFQALEGNMESLLNRNMGSFDRVVGHVEEYGHVTLDGCQYTTKSHNLSQDVKVHGILRVDRVFTHVKYDEHESPCFNTFTFSIEGIDEWFSADGIMVGPGHEEGTAVVLYKPSVSIPLGVVNGMQLEIVVYINRAGSAIPREERITQRAYFKLVSGSDRELDEFLSVARKITNLLCFAINETVSLDSISATSSNLLRGVGENSGPVHVNIYNSSGVYPKNTAKTNLLDTLFGFSDMQNDAGGMINKWVEGYEDYKNAFDLYFLAQLRSQPSHTTKFLSLAQGLEVYHRKQCRDKYMETSEFKKIIKSLTKGFPKKDRNWFQMRLQHANELTLRDRIGRLIEPFEKFVGGEREPQLVDLVVDTRNYLTHYTPRLEPKAAKGDDLYILCLKMELLFELHFLELMGFSPQKIGSIVANRRKLQIKYSLPLWVPNTENRPSF